MLADFAAKIEALDFKERPDYNHLRFILTSVLLDFDASPVEAFRWPIGRDARLQDSFINRQPVVTDESQNDSVFMDTDEKAVRIEPSQPKSK